MEWVTLAGQVFVLGILVRTVLVMRAHVRDHKGLGDALDEHTRVHEREVTRPWN